jgi:hypothetical protein
MRSGMRFLREFEVAAGLLLTGALAAIMAVVARRLLRVSPWR